MNLPIVAVLRALRLRFPLLFLPGVACLAAAQSFNQKGPNDPLGILASSAPFQNFWSHTSHEITVGSSRLKYSAHCGFMPIRGETETEGMMFFIYYQKDNPEPNRPLLFSFNGGPGSSSVWLHLGAVGPKRVKMEPEGWMPAPPYSLEDNPQTWLDKADICFIDPIGTGYSRPTKPEFGSKFWSQQGDIDSIGEFIRMFLTVQSRWTSPLFVVGESYGTFRAAGLAQNLLRRGIALNGIVMVSTTLNFAAIDGFPGNDLPNLSYLPTYAATAWYHKKLPADLQKKSVDEVVAEAEAYAMGDYQSALIKGDDLPESEKERVAGRLARLTGLSKEWILLSNLRFNDEQFRKELLRKDRYSVGRLDSRFKGMDQSGVSEGTDFDPSMTAIRAPYTSTLADYLRKDLKFESEAPYHILGGGVGGWKFPEGSPAETASALRDAMAQNPFLKVHVCAGYYDMATPYLGAKLNLNHAGLDPRVKKNIEWSFYPAGHMMYIDLVSLAKLKREVSRFMDGALKKS